LVKCAYCKKEIKTLAYRCKYCGRVFCPDHMLPENHGCKIERSWYQYKEERLKWKRAALQEEMRRPTFAGFPVVEIEEPEKPAEAPIKIEENTSQPVAAPAFDDAEKRRGWDLEDVVITILLFILASLLIWLFFAAR